MEIGQFPRFTLLIVSDKEAVQSTYEMINLGIRFEDSIVRNYMVKVHDQDGDGELSFKEAETFSKFTSRKSLWGTEADADYCEIEKFSEFKYFKNVVEIAAIFSNCKKLSTIQLPKSLVVIGDSTFEIIEYINNSLTLDPTSEELEGRFNQVMEEIILPESVQIVGKKAFYGMYGLKKVVMPSVASIGENAFSFIKGCSFYIRKSECVLLNDSVDNLYYRDAGVFGPNRFTKNHKIFVPQEYLSFYKTQKYWKNISSSIYGFDYDNDIIP